KKSPVMTSWIPPHGCPLFRITRPICDSLSKSSPSTMEISSIMSTFVLSHLFLAFGFRRIFLTRTSASSFPSPIPAKLCRVIPPMLQAARPVEAVTAIRSGFLAYRFLRSRMMDRINTDFPVPAGPVKNTLRPFSTTSSWTRLCSVLSAIGALGRTDFVASLMSSRDT
ncbi:uncharacterized protein C8A04DRAFT_14868, partial [Dichotomopilus funicola]